MAALSPLKNLEIDDFSNHGGGGDAVTTSEYADILRKAMYWEALTGADWRFDGAGGRAATYLAQMRQASVGLADNKVMQQLGKNPDILKTHLLVGGQLRSREDLAKELDGRAA